MERLFDIKLGKGFRMVAERGIGGPFDREVMISVIREDGVYHQDLALVRNSYEWDGEDPVFSDDMFEVLVWTDANDEDYTERFEILLRKDDEE